ncbi:catalase family protein [Methyloprofundus sp.]|uniref:catalase family protein n=1 Tax=Methyloprofundus sp. TaxID=2020875 RepID=UPI003D0F910E
MNIKHKILMWLHSFLLQLMHFERRLEPWFRSAWNYLFREPVAWVIQLLINIQRKDEGLKIAEEKIDADEQESLDKIIDQMADQMRGRFKPGGYERGGNSKTHGVLHATVTIRDDIPEHCRVGVFAEAKTYPAYVRYAGPGPNVPADIEDVGFMSMSVKLMGVPGKKLMPEEKYTQDFITVTTPTFVTPNTRENAKLQYWSLLDMSLYYFLNPKDTHLLDVAMQSLWNELMSNPLGQRYWSCVPYLLGEGQAMMYSFVPRTEVYKKIPGLPFGHVPYNYLRDNMVNTLNEKDVEFDLMIQLQTDAHKMPIENASVRWTSPFIPVATVHIPRQQFESKALIEFTKRLKMNPWHCLAEHRPLGNQSRARQRMYFELSKFRQKMNQTSHIEPTGDEKFD